jgi:hypothetical protein
MAKGTVRLLRRFPYTSVALALALVVLVSGLFWHINVFELPGVDIIGIEETEAGEIGIAFLLVIPASFVDRVVARQRALEAQLQAEQLRVLQVTMRTVQGIVNNNLNQLQLLRLEAKGHVSNETLTLFDKALEDTAVQLTALGNMKVFAEKPMATGQGLDISTSSGSH